MMNMVGQVLLKAGIKLAVGYVTFTMIRKKIQREFGFDPAVVLKNAVNFATQTAQTATPVYTEVNKEDAIPTYGNVE